LLVILFFPFLLSAQGAVERPKDLDLERLRYNWTWLVEGVGGAGLLLGEKEEQLRQVLGVPTRRGFDQVEVLYYERRTVKVSYYLRKGVIIKIRFHVEIGATESFQFKTSKGLWQSEIEGLDSELGLEFLQDFYGDKEFLRQGETVFFHQQGIAFIWKNGKLRYVDIYYPWKFGP